MGKGVVDRIFGGAKAIQRGVESVDRRVKALDTELRGAHHPLELGLRIAGKVETEEKAAEVKEPEGGKPNPGPAPDPGPADCPTCAWPQAKAPASTAVLKVSNEEQKARTKFHSVGELGELEKHFNEHCQIAGKSCPCCVAYDTEVLTPTGAVRQRLFTPGRTVLTHKGTGRIAQRFAHPFGGELQSISCQYTNFPLRLTPNHPVLAVRKVRHRQEDCWRLAGGIDQGQLSWVSAGDLNNQDFVAFPRLTSVVDMEVATPGLCELMGWYMAEGHLSLGRVTFSLGKHEAEAQERISHLIEEQFGSTPRVYNNSVSTVQVCYNGIGLASFFNSCGHGARYKRLPPWLLTLPVSKQWRFLRGLILGDGHLATYEVNMTTTSKNLAFQLRALLYRLGIIHGLSCRPISVSYIEGRQLSPNGPRYDISISGDAARLLTQEAGLPYNGGQRTSGQFGWVGEGFVFIPVLKSVPMPYRGTVYNMSVPGDESYLTAHCALHNCAKHLASIGTLAREFINWGGGQEWKDMRDWAERTYPVVETAEKVERLDEAAFQRLAAETRKLRTRLEES